jgi:hypothetical protein
MFSSKGSICRMRRTSIAETSRKMPRVRIHEGFRDGVLVMCGLTTVFELTAPKPPTAAYAFPQNLKSPRVPSTRQDPSSLFLWLAKPATHMKDEHDMNSIIEITRKKHSARKHRVLL